VAFSYMWDFLYMGVMGVALLWVVGHDWWRVFSVGGSGGARGLWAKWDLWEV
jgi:hypothetical protein